MFKKLQRKRLRVGTLGTKSESKERRLKLALIDRLGWLHVITVDSTLAAKGDRMMMMIMMVRMMMIRMVVVFVEQQDDWEADQMPLVARLMDVHVAKTDT